MQNPVGCRGYEVCSEEIALALAIVLWCKTIKRNESQQAKVRRLG